MGWDGLSETFRKYTKSHPVRYGMGLLRNCRPIAQVWLTDLLVLEDIEPSSEYCWKNHDSHYWNSGMMAAGYSADIDYLKFLFKKFGSEVFNVKYHWSQQDKARSKTFENFINSMYKMALIAFSFQSYQRIGKKSGPSKPKKLITKTLRPMKS